MFQYNTEKLSNRLIVSAALKGLSTTAIVSLFTTFGQVAQAQGVPANEQADTFFTVDEIVVTARRRSESLFDVPGAVSAFGDSQIKALQASDMTGLKHAVPNFHFERSDSSNAAVYIRGIGQNDSLPFVESGVGVYIDDVYIARSQAAFIELFDVERVEVLRGPQGTLYGRNSPGGAVKLVTKQPGDEFEAYIEAAGGNYDLASINARISGPLNDDGTLRGKISITGKHRNGYLKNVTEGGFDGDTALFAWRALLVYEPSSDFKLDLGFDGKIERPDRSATPVRKTVLTAFPNPVTDPANFVVFQPTDIAFDDPYTVEGTANDLADLTTYAFTLKAQWNFAEDWMLESVSSYRSMSWDLILDADSTALSVLDIPVYEDDEQYSSELRVAYDNARGLSFTGGVYYFHDFDTVLSGFDDANARAVFPFNGTIVTVPSISLGIPSSGYGESRQKTDSIAVFADMAVPLGEATSINFGARYTHDKKSIERDSEFFFDPTQTLSFDRLPFQEGLGFAFSLTSRKQTWNSFTPRLVVSHEIDDLKRIYASVSRGFKSGGFPGRANSDAALAPFDPETVWTYEAGFKVKSEDNRYRLEATYFYNDYKDLQLNGFGVDPVNGTFVDLFTNAANAVTQGVELVASAQVTPEFSLNVSGGYLDADYKEFETLVNGVLTDVSDRRLANAPKWNLFLGATYAVPVGDDLIATFHTDAAYRSSYANETTDLAELNVPKFVNLNAFISVGKEDGSWEVRLGGTNLTNKARAAQSFNTVPFSGVGTAFLAPPRLYDIRVIFRF